MFTKFLHTETDYHEMQQTLPHTRSSLSCLNKTDLQHTHSSNTTPKIKYLSTNKAYFHSIIPFCLTFSMLLMNILLKILNSSYVLSRALAWVWRWRSTKMTIMLGSHQNFRVFLNKCWRKTSDCGFISLQGILCSMYTEWHSRFDHSICNTTLTYLYLNILYWHLLTLPYNRQTGQNCPIKCTSFSSKTENNALLQWVLNGTVLCPQQKLCTYTYTNGSILYIYI